MQSDCITLGTTWNNNIDSRHIYDRLVSGCMHAHQYNTPCKFLGEDLQRFQDLQVNMYIYIYILQHSASNCSKKVRATRGVLVTPGAASMKPLHELISYLQRSSTACATVRSGLDIKHYLVLSCVQRSVPFSMSVRLSPTQEL